MSRFGRHDTAADLNPDDDYSPAHDSRCGTCEQDYNGSDSSGGHHRGGPYGGCCRSFGSMTSFNRHMVGPRTPDGYLRCLTPDEMTAKGWTLDERGAWRTPPPASSPWTKGRAQL